jgi:transposase
MSEYNENINTKRKRYPSDLMDKQWEIVRPIIERSCTKNTSLGGRPLMHKEKDLLDAMLYMFSTGCSLRMLPHDFPHWQTVRLYLSRWIKDNTLESILAELKKHNFKIHIQEEVKSKMWSTYCSSSADDSEGPLIF